MGSETRSPPACLVLAARLGIDLTTYARIGCKSALVRQSAGNSRDGNAASGATARRSRRGRPCAGHRFRGGRKQRRIPPRRLVRAGAGSRLDARVRKPSRVAPPHCAGNLSSRAAARPLRMAGAPAGAAALHSGEWPRGRRFLDQRGGCGRVRCALVRDCRRRGDRACLSPSRCRGSAPGKRRRRRPLYRPRVRTTGVLPAGSARSTGCASDGGESRPVR